MPLLVLSCVKIAEVKGSEENIICLQLLVSIINSNERKNK